VKATAWITQARGGDEALAPSCRASKGYDRIKEKFHLLFFFDLRLPFFRPATTTMSQVAF